MSAISDIAEAVKTILNVPTFSPPFTATRGYLPVFELEDMNTLHVTVVPRTETILPASRSQNQHDYQIDIAVQQRFSDDTNAVIDPLMTLVEAIKDYLKQLQLVGNATALDSSWVRTANEPIYDPAHMSKWRQFTSLLTVTYRVFRPL